MSTIIDLTMGQYGDDAMADINDNFDALNAGKLETSAYTDATTSAAGKTRLSTAPVSASIPIAVGDNDPRVPTALQVGYIPTTTEKDALVGTSGTPSSSNKYVTDADTTGTGLVLRASALAVTQNYTLNENMTALDVAWVDTDGELNTWDGYKTAGDTFYAGWVGGPIKSVMVDTNGVVAMYYRATSTYLVAGTISGDTITWGTPVAVAGNQDGFDLCKVDTNAGCCFQRSSSAFNGYPFTVSGTTITLGSAVQINSNTSNTEPRVTCMACINTNKVVFCYASGAGGAFINLRVGSISANVLTLGTELTNQSASVAMVLGSIAKYDTDKFIASWIQNTATTINIATYTVSGTTITQQSTTTITGTAATSVFGIIQISANLVLISYNTTSSVARYISIASNVPTVQAVNVINSNLFTGEKFVFACIYNSAIIAFSGFATITKSMVFVTRDDAGYTLNPVDTIYYSISGTIGGGITQYDSGKIICCETANPGKGYILNNNARSIVGILQETGTAGQSKPVASVGAISTGHSSLIPGEPYYYQVTGGISLLSKLTAGIDTNPAIKKAGKAISATKFLIETI